MTNRENNILNAIKEIADNPERFTNPQGLIKILETELDKLLLN